jgi:hypothetical protein
VSEPIGVSTGEPDYEVIGNRMNRSTAFGDDDEVRFWVASLDLASSSDVSVHLVDFVGIANHLNLGFVLEKALDVPIKIWISKIVIQHSDRQFQRVELLLLVGTVLSKPGEEAESERVICKRNTMEERHVVCLPSSCNFAGCVAGRTRCECHNESTEEPAPRPFWG